MAEKCIAGADAGSDTRLLGMIGNIVEVVVVDDYLEDRVRRGGTIDVFPSPTARDFFDFRDDRCEALAGFMELRNPSVDRSLVKNACAGIKVRDGDKTMVPDIITHDGQLQEFYEIKPASDSGRRAGRQKIRNFDELRSGMQTAYQPGTLYNPTYNRVFYSATWSGVPVKVALRFEREQQAMVVYKFCVRIDADTVGEALFFIVLRAAIVATLLTRNPIPALAGAALLSLVRPAVRSPLVGSVGSAGANHPSDSRYVQILLNDWRSHQGLAPIVVDGEVGHETINAIRDVQRAETGLVDGRVDPGTGGVLEVLESRHLESLLDRVSDDFLDADHRAGLNDASLAAVMLAPGNADEDEQSPATDPGLPIDVARAVTDELTGYLAAIHDDPFDLVPGDIPIL